MRNILIIDDEQEMLDGLNKIMKRRSDYNLTLIQDPSEAMTTVREKEFDLIITDLKMKQYTGIDILKTSIENYPDSKVIVISGYGTIEASVEAMKEGAFDFLEKPFTSKSLFKCIDRAFEFGQEEESPYGSQILGSDKIIRGVYCSDQMAEIIDIIKKIAPGDMNVLITGESGTGKELIARGIHDLSKRSSNTFVPVNCAALPENLFESELFGYERGAFTGAVKMKPGLLEFANQGTFFFDEIGDLSMNLQVKLLRMLEEQKIRRVGGQNEFKIDVRIIAATNQYLEERIAENKFREDLYYRLNTIEIDIPPLRERIDDILPIAAYILKELSDKNDKHVQGFTLDAEEVIKSYGWPGNIRELQNIIKRAYFLSMGKVIQKNDLPMLLSNSNSSMDAKMLNLSYKNAKAQIFEKFEVEYLTYHLKKHKGNISKTANTCGLDRRSIHRLIKKYNIIYQQ